MSAPVDTRAREFQLQQLLRAALPSLHEMLAEFAEQGGDLGQVAACVIDPRGETGTSASAAVEVLLVPRERAYEIAVQAAPEHAHLLADPSPVGRFRVLAVFAGTGAVVELRLPGARTDAEA